MSAPLSQKQLLRLEWIARLRSGRDKQVRFEYGDTEEGFCAVGLLHHIVVGHGVSIRDAEKVMGRVSAQGC